ncbi:TPA: ABC transporter permease [Stenotrophomonas maltophilia]|nr:ABC transporter permease [Stenotrophomonas maltophilia]
MKAYLRSLSATIRHIFKDRAAVTTIIVASIIYAFYYPAAYQHQVATRMPVVAVDLDRSPASRDLLRKLTAVRDIELKDTLGSLSEAERHIREGHAEGILVIDQRFQRDILRGGQGKLTFLASGALLGRANTVSQGLAVAVAGFSSDAVLEQAQFLGLPAHAALTPIQRPLFNTREGYASAVVTGVSALIVHQTLLTGIILILGSYREERGGRIRLAASTLGGALTAFWLIGMTNMLFYSGFVFWFQDFPRGGNLAGLLLGTAIYIAALVAFGAFVGSFFRVREHAMQFVLMTSMPLYFLSGLSWPRTSIPTWLAYVADLLPSTSGIIAMVKFNQMGASVSEAMPELAKLFALFVLYTSLSFLRYRMPNGAGSRHANGDPTQ